MSFTVTHFGITEKPTIEGLRISLLYRGLQSRNFQRKGLSIKDFKNHCHSAPHREPLWIYSRKPYNIPRN